MASVLSLAEAPPYFVRCENSYGPHCAVIDFTQRDSDRQCIYNLHTFLEPSALQKSPRARPCSAFCGFAKEKTGV